MVKNFKELVEKFGRCCATSKAASENGKRFEVSCKYPIKIQIDGCLIDDEKVEKCDYGFICPEDDVMYFVELKGSDVEKAFSQVTNTIAIFEEQFLKLPKSKKFGAIVSSRNPLSSTETNKLRQRFAKYYGKELHFKNNECKL